MDSLSVIFPAVALDKNTIFVAGTTSGVGRSTDGGSTWHPCMTGITELHILDLAQVNNVLYATTNKGIAKSTDGGELWTSVEAGCRLLQIKRLVRCSYQI